MPQPKMPPADGPPHHPPGERPARVAAAIGSGSVGCLIGLAATVVPLGRIVNVFSTDRAGDLLRSMDGAGPLVLCVFAGGLVGWPLSAFCVMVSRHRYAQRVGAAGMFLSILPALSLALVWGAAFVRALLLRG